MVRPLHRPGLPGNATPMPSRSFPRVSVSFPDGRTIRATGREGATLIALIERGPIGVQPHDFPNGPAYRLAGYIHDLRGMGIAIRTERVFHSIGTHGRYVLESTLRLENVAHAPPKEAEHDQ